MKRESHLHGVGPAIRQARHDAELTQTELAGRLGWPQHLISQYERGARKPGILQVLKIADALGCDFRYDGQAMAFVPR